MPIFLRSFWIDKCNEIQDIRDSAAQKAAQRSKPQIARPPTKPKR